MLVSILVATPHTAFGELLRISLEDSGHYKVRLVKSAKEVRDISIGTSLDLAILDSALTDEPFNPLCLHLLEQQPGIRLVVIPPDNNPNHSALGGLIPHGYLSRPFYLPELLELVSRLLREREKQVLSTPLPDGEPFPTESPSKTLHHWLQEPITLNNYLAEQLPATHAAAAVVVLNGSLPGSDIGKGMVRASAGILSESAVQEMAEVVFRYWNNAEKTDLMRFIRLNSDKKDFLIYATRITGELVLVLVYETSSPLSQVRPQTKALAQRLATQPPDQIQGGELPPVLPAQAEPETQPLDDNLLFNRVSSFSLSANLQQAEPIQGCSGVPAVDDQADSETESETIAEMPLFAEDEAGTENKVINLSALLGAVPSPDPQGDLHHNGSIDSGWVPERSASIPIPTLPGGLNGSQSGETDQVEDQTLKKRNIRTAPLEPQTIPLDTLAGAPALPVDFSLPADTAMTDLPDSGSGRPATLEVKTEPPVMPPGISAPLDTPHSVDNGSNLVLGPEPPIDLLEDTHPNLVTTITSLNQLEPASPTLSLLNYTCVLVPRLPQHYLTGELADRMAVWVQQLCLAFGWRLEGISIRPEYLQWTVQVAPAISPGNLVRIVRQRTSIHVFSNYAHLATENPSGDFWAIGYLIVSGAQPPSAQLLRDYIAQTRKRQGVNK